MAEQQFHTAKPVEHAISPLGKEASIGFRQGVGTPDAGCKPALPIGLSALLVTVLLFLSAGFALAANIDEQTTAIAKQLKCPVCQNIPVAYSQSQLAGEMRQVIRERLAQGESEEAIVQYFVDRYGEDVLLEPRREGFSLLLWVASVGVILFGAVIAGTVLWSWNQTRRVAAVAAAEPSGTDASPASDVEQLFEEEFARYKRDRRS